MTTQFTVSVNNSQRGSVRVTAHSPDTDGNIVSSGGKLIKPGESEDFSVFTNMAYSIEELSVESTEAMELARAKEPLHAGEVLSPHEVYAQPVKQSEL